MKLYTQTAAWRGTLVSAALVVALSGCAPKSETNPANGSGNPATPSASSASLNIAFLPKAVNNPYFVVAESGGKDAAKDMKGQFKQVGPSNSDPAQQATYVGTLAQQGVSAICISASDPNALAPSLKRAMQQGIKVVSYDSDVAPDARSVFVSPSDPELIGRSQLQLLGKLIGYKGKFAILSAASTATNQNQWIANMKDELKKPQYKGMTLVQVAFGDDDPQKSFQQAQSLLQAYPDLRGIISPTSAGLPAAARAIDAAGKSGKIALTGLGTPNLMRKYVQTGTVAAFELWDPNLLGYLAYATAAALVQGKITGKEGDTFDAGKLGKKTIGKDSIVTLGAPTVFDKSNIDKFHF